MAIVLNGTTGIAVPLGSASSPAETNTTSATTGIYYPTSTTLGLSTNGTNAVTIDASQNVGIGTASPSQKLSVAGAGTFSSKILVYSQNSTNILATSSATNATILGTVAKNVAPSGGQGTILITSDDPNASAFQGLMALITDPTASNRRLSFTAIEQGTSYRDITFNEAGAGNVNIGTTSQIQSGKVSISGIAGSGFGPLAMSSPSFPSRTWSTGPDSGGNYVIFNAASAGVYIAYGGTAWTSSSDERLKTDLVPIENAASKVSSLRAVTGRFKTDEEGISRAFLIAQDVLAVLPEAVDATNPDKLGVQYTDVIPLLVAAIKELSAEVEALKAKVGA
jgi:hypothetical protein